MATRYSYLHSRRRPQQVEALQQVLDGLFGQALEELKTMVDSEPEKPVIDPRSRDPGGDFLKQAGLIRKASAERDRALSEKLRLLEQISMMSAVADSPEAEADPVREAEDQAQLQRDLIAAVRGQMDPKKLAAMKAEIPALRDDDDE